LSKYDSATQPWSLEDCYTGGIYAIIKAQASSTYDANIAIWTAGATMGKRQGEWGYANAQGSYATNPFPLVGYYETIYGKRFNGGTTQQFPCVYQRSLIDATHTSLTYNPVITGLPINNIMVPVPYFLPADFGITEVLTSNAISYGDKISSGTTTRHTVLQCANNQNSPTYNAAIAFVAKTTD
jgi:hypothetical protein